MKRKNLDLPVAQTLSANMQTLPAPTQPLKSGVQRLICDLFLNQIRRKVMVRPVMLL